MRFRFKSPSAAMLMSGLALGISAWAGQPSVSVPSTPDAAGKIVVKGAELAAYSNVTVRFMHEKLSPIDVVVQVAANGSFALKFDPPIVGGYTVMVYDRSGQKVGQGNFGHFR